MPEADTGESTGTFKDLRTAVQIDKNDLDTCLVEQPDLFYRVSEQYTLARSMQDEIKYDITKARAELGAQFRSENTDDKGKGPTVDALNQMIDDTVRMRKLSNELLAASTMVGKWAALKEAYDMRASALKSLTQLFSSNYFTVQTGSRPRADAIERSADAIRREAGEERQSRPRMRPRAADE